MFVYSKTALTDEEVIRNYWSSEPRQCFEALYQRYVKQVYRRCLSMTQDSARAQDFTQDIFLKVYSRLDSFQERSRFSTWLYSVAHNYCLDQIRQGKRLSTVALDDGDGHELADSDEAQVEEETLQLVNRALQTLSPDEAALLRLKYEEGLSVDALAQQYSLTPSAVKMRLKRSRDKIYQFYQQQSIS